MIVGVAAVAIIFFKSCQAKRYRNRQRQMQQMANQPHNLSHQYQPNQQLYPVNPHAYPSPQIQMGRPYPQPEPLQAYPQPQVVRGRVHDSYLRPQAAENSLECQIRFH